MTSTHTNANELPNGVARELAHGSLPAARDEEDLQSLPGYRVESRDDEGSEWRMVESGFHTELGARNLFGNLLLQDVHVVRVVESRTGRVVTEAEGVR